MNAETEMQHGDGLGAEPEEKGTIYALAVVVEADSAEEAFDRVSAEVGPEPANAHFVGEPVEIERADEYDTESVGVQIVKGIKADRGSFTIHNDPRSGEWTITSPPGGKVYGPYTGSEDAAIHCAREEGANI